MTMMKTSTLVWKLKPKPWKLRLIFIDKLFSENYSL
jgi:hypothetical protein